MRINRIFEAVIVLLIIVAAIQANAAEQRRGLPGADFNLPPGGTSVKPAGQNRVPGQPPVVVIPTPGPGGATITLECGANKYTLTTGTRGGNCRADKDKGTAYCEDSSGKGLNSADASCAKGCISSNGAGECK